MTNDKANCSYILFDAINMGPHQIKTIINILICNPTKLENKA